MDVLDIRHHLRQLDIVHREDGDGGYTLVSAIRNWMHTFTLNDREALLDVLVEMVAQKDPTLWGVSLETLVEEGSVQTSNKLASLFERTDQDAEWNDQICLALLRLSYLPLTHDYVRYIKLALDNDRRVVLPLVAALCRVDPDACLTLSANYFSRVLLTEQSTEKHRGYIPAFIRNFFETDKSLLVRLVEMVKLIEPLSAKKLDIIIDEYMQKINMK